MKHSILLLVLLIGLVLLDWGCGICGGRTDYALSQISNDVWTISNPELQAFDSFQYTDGVIDIKLNWEVVALREGSSNALYACGEHEFYYVTDLKDVVVSSAKKYADNYIPGNQSSIFSVRGNMEDTLNASLIHTRFASYAPFFVDSNLELVFNSPPSKTDTFQFTFQFFDTEGNVFETTTEPIIITP